MFGGSGWFSGDENMLDVFRQATPNFKKEGSSYLEAEIMQIFQER